MLEKFLRPFEPGRGLQEQLREQLLNALLDGAISPLERLPSSRKLSRLLNVSRNTVMLVYEQMVQDGFLTPASRRGYFINETFLRQQQRLRLKPVPHKLFQPTPDAPNWARRMQQRLSLQPAIIKPENWREFPYPFIYGQVPYDDVLGARWRHCGRLASMRAHMRSWVDDAVTFDDPLLMEQIVQRILPRRAIRAQPEEVLVTIGTQNSLYLLSRLLGHAGLRFGMEDPGYVDARSIFMASECQIVPLRVDSQGLVPGPHLHACDMVFCTPSHQSPTGATMPVYRRMDLIERAREHDIVLIEDDYDTEFNPLGGNHPALKSFDDCGRVIYLGSLSKNLMPGLRMGFIVADAGLIQELRALRRYMYRHPPLNNQRAMAIFLSMGYGDEHARRWQDELTRKWHLMARAMEKHLPDFQYTGQPGGSSLWVQGPPGFNAWDLQRLAARRGVLIEPGSVHFHVQTGTPSPKAFFRLGFSVIAAAQIDTGIEQLSLAWQDLRSAQAADSGASLTHDLHPSSGTSGTSSAAQYDVPGQTGVIAADAGR